MSQPISLFIDSPALPCEQEVKFSTAREVQQHILTHKLEHDASISFRIVDKDDMNIVIPGSVVRGEDNAAWYSTLRTLLLHTSNVAGSAVGVFEDTDEIVASDMRAIRNGIAALRSIIT